MILESLWVEVFRNVFSKLDIVQEDAQKKLPALLGDVIVSTAGQLLKQKYIFHCMTIDKERDKVFYQKYSPVKLLSMDTSLDNA